MHNSTGAKRAIKTMSKANLKLGPVQRLGWWNILEGVGIEPRNLAKAQDAKLLERGSTGQLEGSRGFGWTVSLGAGAREEKRFTVHGCDMRRCGRARPSFWHVQTQTQHINPNVFEHRALRYTSEPKLNRVLLIRSVLFVH